MAKKIHAGKENKSAEEENKSAEEPELIGFRDPNTDVDVERLKDVIEGSGSGIKNESPTSPARSTVSSVQLLSFTVTVTGFDLCQQRLETAWLRSHHIT